MKLYHRRLAKFFALNVTVNYDPLFFIELIKTRFRAQTAPRFSRIRRRNNIPIRRIPVSFYENIFQAGSVSEFYTFFCYFFFAVSTGNRVNDNEFNGDWSFTRVYFFQKRFGQVDEKIKKPNDKVSLINSSDIIPYA